MNHQFYKEKEDIIRIFKINEHLPLYHGIRTKTPDKILKEGICSFRTAVDTRKAIIDALTAFSKERFMRREGTRGMFVRSFKDSMTDPRRRVVYLTSMNKESACSWASRNPEFIYLTLFHVGVNDNEIFEYLRRTFGKPHVIILNETYPDRDPNINSGQRCIESVEIKSIELCKT